MRLSAERVFSILNIFLLNTSLLYVTLQLSKSITVFFLLAYVRKIGALKKENGLNERRKKGGGGIGE